MFIDADNMRKSLMTKTRDVTESTSVPFIFLSYTPYKQTTIISVTHNFGFLISISCFLFFSFFTYLSCNFFFCMWFFTFIASSLSSFFFFFLWPFFPTAILNPSRTKKRIMSLGVELLSPNPPILWREQLGVHQWISLSLKSDI